MAVAHTGNVSVSNGGGDGRHQGLKGRDIPFLPLCTTLAECTTERQAPGVAELPDLDKACSESEPDTGPDKENHHRGAPDKGVDGTYQVKYRLHFSSSREGSLRSSSLRACLMLKISIAFVLNSENYVNQKLESAVLLSSPFR
jgi:hypothetical protein